MNESPVAVAPTDIPQPGVLQPLTSAAIFLVATVEEGVAAAEQAATVVRDTPSLVRAVGARDPAADLTCVVGIGAAAWPRLVGGRQPMDLHPFRNISSGGRVAPATAGDVLFHIRAQRFDLCFALATRIAASLESSASIVDEVHGFQYFDHRDLTGFVDGTENPVGQQAMDAVIVGGEDGEFAGGAYVTVQKYIHDFALWNRLPVAEQEGIIGRTKFDDVELSEDAKPSFAHNALTSLEEDGEEIPIVRRNMPFGTVSPGGAGTYFIAYSRSPRPVERMLERMFIGEPPGNYDRLLDFTHAVTGTMFFVPGQEFISRLGDEEPGPAPSSREPALEAIAADSSLKIGNLRGVSQS